MKKNIGRRLLLALLVLPAASAFSQDSPKAVLSAAACPDPLGAVNRLYDSVEAARFDASSRFFAPDAVFDTWATGVNGHMMVRRHLVGRDQIRRFLPEGRGLRWRLPGVGPDGPLYRQAKVSVAGNVVRFSLQPDRRRPDGREYNYFTVEAVLSGCAIASLTVIEQITWLSVPMKNAAPLLALGLLLLSGCATQAGYLVKQGGYLLRDGSGARPVDQLLKASSTPADTKDFLHLVQEIKSFAFGKVGLRDNGNYRRYKELSRDHLVDVVSACDAVSFTPYMWKYPFLGKLPYKGFYEKPDADAEAARLKKESWDVITRPVDAFSTLGFTKDPLYSFMKKYPPFELASLIIHEQTHATLFVKGQPQFNEELAVFVGDEGAFEWMKEKYGLQSKEYQEAVDQQADSATFIGLLHGLSDELEAVYTDPQPREVKLSRKAEIIGGFQERLGGELAARFRTEGYRDLGKLRLNNAYLSLYRLYTDDVPLLRSYWERRCGSDLRVFMQAAIALSKKGDVKAQMRAELASS